MLSGRDRFGHDTVVAEQPKGCYRLSGAGIHARNSDLVEITFQDFSIVSMAFNSSVVRFRFD
jgi:hypothetical protein